MSELDEDFVDIGDKKKIWLTKDQLEFARDNPSGLTKEGCEYELENWKNSHNRYQVGLYTYMLKKCENFTASGKTVTGASILARKDNKIVWVSNVGSE